MSASTSREVRENQLKLVEARVELRVATLTERGIDDAARAKDPTLKNLKAQLKKARGRLTSMEASVAHVTKIADERKAAKEKKAAAAEKKAKGGKNAKGAKPQGGAKKAKKK